MSDVGANFLVPAEPGPLRARRTQFAFIAPAEFGRQVDDWIRTMRATRPARGTAGPLIPGDPNRRAREVRLVEGVPLFPAVVQSLERVSARTGIPLA